MKMFGERNQVTAALVGSVLLVIAVLIALDFGKLPGIAPSRHTYRADFADAGGLAAGDVVRVAGVDVGSVKSLSLAGDRVRVTFSVSSSIALGSQTVVHAKVLSVLGLEYLQVDPGGGARLGHGQVIPLAQTTPAYTLIDVLGQLGQQTQALDVPELQKALEAISATLTGEPATLKTLFASLATVSGTLGSRQAELAQLLDSAAKVSTTLQGRQGQLIDLFGQSNLLLQVLAQRRQDIHDLLVDVTNLGNQINGLIGTNQAALQPLLGNLAVVSSVLAKDQGALDEAVPLLASFDRWVANASGSTNFADVISPTLLIPDNALVECARPGATGVNGCTP